VIRASAVVLAFAALAACSGKDVGLTDRDISGSWNYFFNISAGPEDQCVGTGTFQLSQSGSAVTGSVQSYSGNCLAVTGALVNSSFAGDSIVLHAGVCTLTGAVLGSVKVNV